MSKETDKNIDGILSFAGIINREVDRNLAGDLDFSGDLAVSKLYSRGVDGNFYIIEKDSSLRMSDWIMITGFMLMLVFIKIVETLKIIT